MRKAHCNCHTVYSRRCLVCQAAEASRVNSRRSAFNTLRRDYAGKFYAAMMTRYSSGKTKVLTRMAVEHAESLANTILDLEAAGR